MKEIPDFMCCHSILKIASCPFVCRQLAKKNQLPVCEGIPDQVPQPLVEKPNLPSRTIPTLGAPSGLQIPFLPTGT